MTDVLIIGGGVIGLSLARELHKKGLKKITILERGALGREASFAAAGMLAPNAETEKSDAFYRFCDESNRLYPQFAAELLDETGVDIELEQQGTLYLALSENDSADIRRRFEWQKTAGLAVEHFTAQETRRSEPFVSPDVRESLFFPNDWQVENRQLLRALAKYAAVNGIEIHENTAVTGILSENGKVVGARATNAKFFAEKTVIAAGAWSSLLKNDFAASIPSVKPIRGQIIVFQTAKRLFEKVIYSPRGYLVPRRDGRILIGATVEDAGFDKTVTAEGERFLREIAHEIAPSLANLEISETWAGLRPLAADAFPILGSFPPVENFYLATAHYRNGILLAPLTAQITAGKIVENNDSEYLEIFSPRRFQAAGTT